MKNGKDAYSSDEANRLRAFIVLGSVQLFRVSPLVDTAGSGPLGQGGYSLLLNGENIAELLQATFRSFVEYSGQMIFAVCFVGSFILWSMGIA